MKCSWRLNRLLAARLISWAAADRAGDCLLFYSKGMRMGPNEWSAFSREKALKKH
jgi:hypothetical protein